MVTVVNGNVVSSLSKAVVLINIFDGERLEFVSLSAAARYLNTTRVSVSNHAWIPTNPLPFQGKYKVFFKDQEPSQNPLNKNRKV